MIDRVSEKTRSYIMSREGSKDTGPEMTVRRMLHRLGYRYRLHRGDLPGSPDLVFRKRRKVVFVHGCFWHGHDCRGGRLPESKADYWLPKIAANRKRDAACIARLEALGWDSFVVWQCRLREPARLRSRLVAYLGPAK